jgi:primosomal protein N' (replication factor Y)
VGAHRRRRRPRRGGEGAGLSERPRAGRVCRVQPDVPAVRRAFDYTLPDTLTDAVRVGTIVRVPLHGRRVRGWVLDADVAAEVEDARLRAVHAVVSAGPPPDVVDLCTWTAWRWAGPLATFLRAASPPNVVPAGPEPEPETAVYPPDADAPSDPLVVVAPDGDDAALIARVIAPEGSTVVVDPDGTRSARVVMLLEQRGREVVSVRSDRDAAELTAAWDRARSGACVVVGGRTAIWAPVPDLARVVVVDEADEALEDERAPTWNARDVAFERVRRARAAIRVVTPAPTVDALVALGDPLPATERVPWPRVTVVDTRDESPGQALLSSVLADELRRLRDAGRRSVCVLNRRGRARLLACRTCGELARCERCGATVDEREDALSCPRCEQTRPVVCVHCHGTRFRAVRPGVHRVRDDLAALLPRASVAAVDASTLALPDDDVLVGTEAVLHRAPRDGTVGLVAFLELDQELLAPRARAAEQALWLLVRAARVLGPRSDRGLLLLQTRLPEHEVVVAARDGAPLVVAAAERARRRVLGWPPFGGAAELTGEPGAVAAACDALRAVSGVTVLGPVDEGARALVRAASVRELCDALAHRAVDSAHAIGRLRVDVDPRRA